MKRVKRLLAVVLTLMMLVGCATTVFALDDFESSSKRSPVQEKAAKTLESGAFDLSRIGELSRDNCRITSLEPSDEKVFVDLIHFFLQEPKKKIVHIFRLDTIGEVTFDLSSIDIKKSESYTAYYLMRSGEWGTKGIKVTGTKNGVLSIRSSVSGPVIIAKNEKGAVTAKPKSVKVSPAKYTLDVEKKKTVQLTATVSPTNADQTVTWKPDNTKVITVDKNGVVTAVGRGTAKVTAKTSNGKKATCRITVTGPIKIKTFKMNKSSATIDLKKKSKTLQLKVNVSPSNATNRTITWKSSNKAVATVKPNGQKATVTGLKGGYTDIIATGENGAKIAKCRITVKEPIKVTGVTLDKSTAEVNVKKSVTLRTTLIPAKPTNKKVKWTSSNTRIATVNSKGKVTGKKPGTVTITVTTDDGRKTATCEVTVKETTKKK